MKKLKLLLSLVLLVCIPALSFSQNKTITGKVTDSKDNSPLADATVSAAGKTATTKTGSDGSFTLSVPEGVKRLYVSYVGYAEQTVSISGSVANVSMVSSSQALTDVVVIGYGTARRKDLTGSITTIQSKNFNKGTYTSADQLIQGKVAGVLMINNTGMPGGASTVKIRGNSTVTGSGQPLYVVDGVPLDGRSARPGLGDAGFGGSNPGGNPLNFMNPSDIASIDVLKDASATAIYGSRAAYGVVLITTKRGQSGQPKIDFGASFGFSKIAKKLKVLTASQYREAIKYYGTNPALDEKGDVDALDQILRKGLVQNYNVAVSGGTDNAKFRLSMAALNQEGIVKKTGFKKYSANMNANFKFLEEKNVGLDINIIPSQYIEQIAPIANNSGSRGSLIGNALQWNPTKSLVVRNKKNTADSFAFKRDGDLFNPLAVQDVYNDQSKVTTVLASLSPFIKFAKSFEYRYLYSINYSSGARRTSIHPDINIPTVLGKGQVFVSESELVTQQSTHTLNYNEKITSAINMNAVIGYEYLKYSNKGTGLNAVGATGSGGFGDYGLDYTDYIQFSNPTNRNISSYKDPTYEIQSYFGRVGLNMNDKYLLTATVRRDGSTKFGSKFKYGNFPSFSVAWVVNKESFFKSDLINSLKIRGGWGKTGNQEFPSGSAQRRYNFAGDGLNYTISNNANDSLKWQSDRQYNFGFDMAILKNKVNITVDYFNKKTTDLLFPTIPLQPAAPGGAVTWKNIDGEIVNKGLEVAINSTIISKKDFSWDFGVNATFISNKVSNLKAAIATGRLNGKGSSDANVETIRNGFPINSFWTRSYAGLDKLGTNILPNGDAPSYQGTPNPTKLLGISTAVNYKKLTLTLNLSGAFGHSIYNESANNVLNVANMLTGTNIALSVYKDPQKELLANAVTSSARYIEKGDYLKLNNATLSYGVGNIGKMFKNLNVYITGQNLLVFTGYTGFDPEINVDKSVNSVPSVGIEYIPYPSAKTITVGLNVSL